jgi:hypothetical protein
MVISHGPDFKARTDLAEREEKARLEARQKRQAPERLDHRHPDNGHLAPPEPQLGNVSRLWRRIRG